MAIAGFPVLGLESHYVTSGDWILDSKHLIIFYPRSVFTQDSKQQWIYRETGRLSNFGFSWTHRVPEKNASAGPEAGLGHRADGPTVLLCPFPHTLSPHPAPFAPFHSHVKEWNGQAGDSALHAQGSPARCPAPRLSPSTALSRSMSVLKWFLQNSLGPPCLVGIPHILEHRPQAPDEHTRPENQKKCRFTWFRRSAEAIGARTLS